MINIKDKYKRHFTYLRLSLTELCNFNCSYCMPNKNIKKKENLSIYEIYNLVMAFKSLKIKKIRLTGGEPTLRKDFNKISKLISSFKELIAIVFTTNGYKLKNDIYNIKKLGFTGINISLDTLNDKNFNTITKKLYFKNVYEGIIKTINYKISVKINIVLSNYFSLSDFMLFYSLAKYKNISIRFINQMETSLIKKNKNNINADLILNFLKKNSWLIKNRNEIDGPAIVMKNKIYKSSIGVINPYLNNFCKSCNRLRISSNGDLFLCLFGNEIYSLKNLIKRSNQKKKLITFIKNTMYFKSKNHKLNYNIFGKIKNLSIIGG